MRQTYLDVDPEAAKVFFSRPPEGAVLMLNLLRFRKIADYSATPALAPASPVSGREAYEKYIERTAPFLTASGGEVVLMAEGGAPLIGPSEERWDMALIVRQASVSTFLAFASNEAYLAGIGHRTAALEDSRLLPLTEIV